MSYIYDELYEDEYEYNTQLENCKRYIQIISDSQDQWNYCPEEDVSVGDIIYVDYITCSQKYIYTHKPECGIVISVNKNGSENDIVIINQNGEYVSIIKGHLSMYSRGYELIIKKLQ